MRWTEEAIVEAIQRWDRIYGKPPRVKDWRLASPPFWPSVYTAVDRFGTWGEALSAAGFQRRRGRPPRRAPVERAELLALAHKCEIPVDIVLQLGEPNDGYHRYRIAKEALVAAPPSPLRDLMHVLLTGNRP